jgi:hypothetical protein
MEEAQPAQAIDECVLLMKGGITSGIVYPWQVDRLLMSA